MNRYVRKLRPELETAAGRYRFRLPNPLQFQFSSPEKWAGAGARQRPKPRVGTSHDRKPAGQGHHGGVYQAGGWIYEVPKDTYTIEVRGQRRHGRSIGAKYGRHDLAWLRENVAPEAKAVRGLVRHKYLMPLDERMRAAVEPLAKPYPKRNQIRAETRGEPGERLPVLMDADLRPETRAKQATAEHHSAQRPGSADPHAPLSAEKQSDDTNPLHRCPKLRTDRVERSGPVSPTSTFNAHAGR